jgi:septal ring-binding cell division protein DamX
MATINWKILSLLTATLLVALGLQVGAIKIMIDLAHPSAASADAVAERTAPLKPVVSVAAIAAARREAVMAEERSASEPAPTAPEAKSAIPGSDPPHLADSTAKIDPAPREPSPEVPQPTPPVPLAAPGMIPVEPKPEPVNGVPASSTPATTAATPPSAEPATVGALQKAAWLKTRDPKHYTVQIYSGRSLDTLKEMATATATAEPQAYFSMATRSGPWYSLVVGDYPDSASAQAAMARINARSPALKPSIRRFAEIQAKLR